MKSILVTNIKGGVAKSSTAVALATGLKTLLPKSKILLIDGDPQGSIKTYFGLKLQNSNDDFASFLIEDTPFESSIQQIKTQAGPIDVMISSRKLSEADVRMAAFHRREETLKGRFKKQNIQYDFCIIDSSPAMNLVLLNFMTFADYWLIPATMDAFALSNINYLFEQKKLIEEFYDKIPEVLGILPTMHDKRAIVSQQALAAVKTKFEKVCKIFEPIGIDSTVKKAQVKRQLIYDFPESRAAQGYKALTTSIIEALA
jgi:chromosome partitioning protein